MDDLPDGVLVDILCRLPSYRYVYKYKSVCRRWNNLMSEPYFIGRFLLRLQNKHKQALSNPPLTLINLVGETFPIALNPSSPKFLARLFQRLMSSISPDREPLVLGASHDLVLCCTIKCYHFDYFICNPYTTQWVALPPPHRHQTLGQVPIGFICEPFYNYYKKDSDQRGQTSKCGSSTSTIIDDGHGQLININIKYRYRVVRIHPTVPFDVTFHDYIDPSSKVKVEIFSSETGEWRESIISFPREFCFNEVQSNIYFAHHGMLYWSSSWTMAEHFLIGLDPFIISHTNNNNMISNSGCRFIKLIVKDPTYKPKNYGDRQIKCLGVPGGGGGCLQLCLLEKLDNSLTVWELKEEEDLIVAPDGAEVWCSKEKRLVLNNMEERVDLMDFDPQEEGFLYLLLDGTRFVKINVRTRSLTQEIIDVAGNIRSGCFFPLRVDPRWPTPLPRLPHQRTTEGHPVSKTGPGNLERDMERRFSYALGREDIENAVRGGP
ncbi:hypothetical protein M0R45_038244 [Rubus argutus]|uniref:F-box domain-containing protein n=1 Tax=Rubus argutus TaxID=59490 RepID=A0AAW1W4Z9_RUBAR